MYPEDNYLERLLKPQLYTMFITETRKASCTKISQDIVICIIYNFQNWDLQEDVAFYPDWCIPNSEVVRKIFSTSKEMINMSVIHKIHFVRTMQANLISFLHSKTSSNRYLWVLSLNKKPSYQSINRLKFTQSELHYNWSRVQWSFFSFMTTVQTSQVKSKSVS